MTAWLPVCVENGAGWGGLSQTTNSPPPNEPNEPWLGLLCGLEHETVWGGWEGRSILRGSVSPTSL